MKKILNILVALLFTIQSVSQTEGLSNYEKYRLEKDEELYEKKDTIVEEKSETIIVNNYYDDYEQPNYRYIVVFGWHSIPHYQPYYYDYWYWYDYSWGWYYTYNYWHPYYRHHYHYNNSRNNNNYGHRNATISNGRTTSVRNATVEKKPYTKPVVRPTRTSTTYSKPRVVTYKPSYSKPIQSRAYNNSKPVRSTTTYIKPRTSTRNTGNYIPQKTRTPSKTRTSTTKNSSSKNRR